MLLRSRPVDSPTHDPTVLPAGLPVPIDDGRASHLFGAVLPSVALPSTAGGELDLASLHRAVLFFYPRTGIPGQPPSLGYSGEDWDTIPGARGCTPQSCGFRDLHTRFQALGVRVLGISTSEPAHQAEFVSRMRMPFPMLSDAGLALTNSMRLPTFRFPVESGGPDTLIERMGWYIERGIIHHVWHPVFPPDRHAHEVLEWLTRRGSLAVVSGSAERAVFIRDELRKHWITTTIYSRDVRFEADRLPALIALDGGRPLGLLTYAIADSETEIITLSSRDEGRGIGASLLATAIGIAREAACGRVFLTTTNDNLRALGFYQRRGFRMAALFPGMIDKYRERYERTIPRVATNGLPIRDELELEYPLRRDVGTLGGNA